MHIIVLQRLTESNNVIFVNDSCQIVLRLVSTIMKEKKRRQKTHLIWSSFWFSLNVQDFSLNVFSCILKNVKNIIKLTNLNIFHLKAIVIKIKLIVAKTYINSTSDQFCYVTVTFKNNKAAYQLVTYFLYIFISYTLGV